MLHLKLKNDRIYDDNEFPDYDFFSPDFIRILLLLQISYAMMLDTNM